jgi:hypothetical protein
MGSGRFSKGLFAAGGQSKGGKQKKEMSGTLLRLKASWT